MNNPIDSSLDDAFVLFHQSPRHAAFHSIGIIFTDRETQVKT